MNTSSAELGLYKYEEYGIDIRYPAHWIVEPFAFYDKHLPGFHPGHLPGLPIQVLQPTQLDMLKFDTQQAIVGFYAPTSDDEQVSVASFVVLVEKVSGTNSLFSNPLDNYVKSFVFENTDPNFPYRNSDVQARVLELYEGNVGGNKAIIVVLEKDSILSSEHHREKIMNGFMLKEDRIYTLEYTALLDKYDKYFPSAQLMIESFQTPSISSNRQLIGMAAIIATAATIATITVVAKRNKNSGTSLFLSSLRRILPAALGIEILCLSAAEIGGNLGLFLFGFNLTGIGLAYALVYAFAGFTTFCTILGRTTVPRKPSDDHHHGGNETEITCDCCSILENDPNMTFFESLKTTLKQFATGFMRLIHLEKEVMTSGIIKTSLIILVTAESGCIVTAATVDFLLYQYSIFISVPLSLIAGTLAVAGPQAIRIARRKRHEIVSPETR